MSRGVRVHDAHQHGVRTATVRGWTSSAIPARAPKVKANGIKASVATVAHIGTARVAWVVGVLSASAGIVSCMDTAKRLCSWRACANILSSGRSSYSRHPRDGLSADARSRAADECWYEGGGPRILDAQCPEWMAGQGWSFEAGDCRASLAYRFMIGPDGAFGIDACHWTPLHADTDGWVESLALADHARRWAGTVTRIKGKAVEALDLGGFEPVPEVRGVTDHWWRGEDSLIAVYRGEAKGFDAPQCLEAHIYGGLDEWALHSG